MVITEKETNILRTKLIGFNKVLIAKYGDKYSENVDRIMFETQAYKEAVISQLKNKR